MVVYTTCFLSAKSRPGDLDVAIFHENPVLYIYTYMGNMDIPPFKWAPKISMRWLISGDFAS